MRATATKVRRVQPTSGATGRSTQRRHPAVKAVLFRAAAVLIGLLPLLACEVALRGLGMGKPTDCNDPFVGFSDLHPLFVLNEIAGRYEIPSSRLTHFEPESFAAHKSPDEFRIFVLGGSTVQGRPWSIETSFTTWLELNLNVADPTRQYEVVNCGGISYASYRLVPILQEVLNYRPDLIIFCEGHNEFLEDRSYSSLKSTSPVWAWPQRQVARLRTYNLVREGVCRLAGRLRSPASGAATDRAGGRPVILGSEANTRLDWKDGLDKYRRDAKWQADVIAHFEFNLRRIAAITDRAEVPLLFVSPVSNLQWAPFKPEHRRDITPDERAEFLELLADAEAAFADDPSTAAEHIQRATSIDDQHAGAHYELGICLLELNRPQEAQAELVLAKDLDVCPLRMLESMKQVIRTVSVETGTPLIDADALIAINSRSGFPDGQWLVDHVHPTVEGHQLIADAVAVRLEEAGIVARTAESATARDKAYRRHLAGLSHTYFTRGRDRLRGEQRWAHGLVRRAKAP